MYVYYYAVYICFVRTNNVSILPQITTIVVFLVFLVLCIVGVSRVKEGLDLTDVVPKNTNEYRFLEAQSKYFGFYNFYAVTKVWVAGGGGAYTFLVHYSLAHTSWLTQLQPLIA